VANGSFSYEQISAAELDDTGGEEGTTYYFMVRAVDADGDESVPSKAVSATANAAETVDSRDGGGGCVCFIGSAAGRL